LASPSVAGALAALVVFQAAALDDLWRASSQAERAAWAFSRGGLPLGSSAPNFQIERDGGRADLRAVTKAHAKTTVLFVDPECAACEVALEATRKRFFGQAVVLV